MLRQTTSIKIEADGPEDKINSINEETQRSIVSEIDILKDINKNFQTLNSILKDMITPRNQTCIDMTMDMSLMEDFLRF